MFIRLEQLKNQVTCSALLVKILVNQGIFKGVLVPVQELSEHLCGAYFNDNPQVLVYII